VVDVAWWLNAIDSFAITVQSAPSKKEERGRASALGILKVL
jgi:hypothetical protein